MSINAGYKQLGKMSGVWTGTVARYDAIIYVKYLFSNIQNTGYHRKFVLQ